MKRWCSFVISPAAKLLIYGLASYKSIKKVPDSCEQDPGTFLCFCTTLAERSDLVVGAEDVFDLVSNDRLDVRAAVGQVLTGIEVIRMLHEVLADACGQAEAQVGVDVDLADCASCSLTKLIFRNADSILQGAAVLVDDLDIFLRNGGRSVQNDREARESLCGASDLCRV